MVTSCLVKPCRRTLSDFELIAKIILDAYELFQKVCNHECLSRAYVFDMVEKMALKLASDEKIEICSGIDSIEVLSPVRLFNSHIFVDTTSNVN